METKELMTAIGSIAAEVAEINVNTRAIRTEVSLVSSQVKFLSQLMEDVAMEGSVQTERSKDALTSAYDLLQNSPLTKHPMFKDMLKPIEEMMQKQKA